MKSTERRRLTIIDAIRDDNLLRPFLGKDLSSWRSWMTALRCLYGQPVKSDKSRALILQCTGRDADRLPEDGFSTALFLTGRRSGKSRTAAVIGAFEAVLAGHESKLAKGEKGVVAVCAPTLRQGRIVKDYLRAVFDTPILHDQLAGETKEGFDLSNGTRIEILAGDWRTVRGFTLIAAVIDELCFFGVEETSKIRSDTELIRAIKPSLATIGGRLIAISTPYAKRGWGHAQWKKHHGNNEGRVLVWNCPSRTMNPTLPQSVVDDALAEDLQAAKAEYLGEFRDDVAEFLPRSVIEALVVQGRKELLPRSNLRYFAFADLSGGRVDDTALAIAHKDERKVVLDKLIRYRPPFNPHEVVGRMAEALKEWGIRSVTGDNYAAEFVSRAFVGCGLHYVRCEKPKSVLYSELLPRMCSGEIELLDNEVLVNQLAGLERRVRAGGKDIIDHPSGGHDDLANALAGVSQLAVSRRLIGVIGRRPTRHPTFGVLQ